MKPSPRDEHLGSFPAGIFLWDAFSGGLMVKKKKALESIRWFSCPHSHATFNFSEESLFQLEMSILYLRWT